MKFSFDADLDYQRQAIDAVTGLFRGQEVMTSQFTVHAHPAVHASFDGFSDLGYGNMLRLDPETILANLHDIQHHTGLAPETSLDSMNFTIEMETGTGKTYVYLRTIYELHQFYGFTKFMIVVPSVAIKEGVETSVRMLREHFGSLYGNPPMSFFQFDGGNLSRVRSFATSSSIQIMIVTVAAINKKTNKIYQPAEDLDFEVPADLIRATNPIIIVDEPQSVYGDTGIGSKKGAGRGALEDLNALATLRYSATHSKGDKANLVYRLDAIAAYEKQLVKQIEVDSLVTSASGTTPYVKLLGVTRGKGGAFTARVEADVEQGNEIKRKAVTVDTTSRRNLADVTGRELYKDLTVVAINAAQGQQSISFDTVTKPLNVGDSIGAEVSIPERARQMIAQTIRQHLLKEQEFAIHEREIKVLSLFFVDSVAKYREYGSDGEALPGEYVRIFEEEYTRIASEPQFNTLLGDCSVGTVAKETHQGYFSVDRRKGGAQVLVETIETTDKGRQQASLAYEQIMRDKVGLTTPGTPLRFIFSHSALQEGWDNPNVFQICVLRNMGTERWRRQSIGRGLRLCVDGAGNRVHGFDINRLTVIANESYEEFADRLQREMAEDLGIQFGVITVDGFARLSFKAADGEVFRVGSAAAQLLCQALFHEGYIDVKGKVQDRLRQAVQSGDANLAKVVKDSVHSKNAAKEVLGLIKRLAKPMDVKKAGERLASPLVQERLESPEFKELWDRIQHRTEYRVEVDEASLRDAMVKALRGMLPVPKRRGEWLTHRVKRIDHSGLTTEAAAARRADVTYADSEDLPDILSVLADRTQLTRATLAHVLTESGTLGQFRDNPQAYIDQAGRQLNITKADFLVKGLRYELVDPSRPEAECRYTLSLLRDADLAGYTGLGGNIVSDAEGNAISFEKKSVYRYLVVDSNAEKDFALALLQRPEIKTFVKLPSSFKIPTPLGNYNPDWALTVERTDGSRYIVFETKGVNELELLRPIEQGKITSARIHFDTVKDSIGIDDLEYEVINGIEGATSVMERDTKP
ncbi:restriction endonuclease [Streptantibioticus silvisoli]|uniref:DEAD/DEAH box helicase family protein n=1 Tax=Streptantibioticus silvisoli TaxID=2705255 RepID=A0ABT6VZN6_9ACTN|nr:DEAD/DEAH box helicase family protein [Streptantibioticus silvisoli]MDI5962928.1 DEAD/DEAH box helicase family protein [Streptantibioticus silvisoli]